MKEEKAEVKGEFARLNAGGVGAAFDCGCFVTRVSGGMELDRCPKHAAAPEMYEFLRRIEATAPSSEMLQIHAGAVALLSKIDGIVADCQTGSLASGGE
jgi:hypothetical protein